MNIQNSIKDSLIQFIIESLSSKVTDLENSVTSIKESRDSDTKSSAGDKFETSRAMAQMEMENYELQLSKTKKQINEINQISLIATHQKVKLGSLVQCNNGNYFISIAYGKICIENKNYYAISLVSPIGQLLKDKKIGESIHFNGKAISIEHIV